MVEDDILQLEKIMYSLLSDLKLEGFYKSFELLEDVSPDKCLISRRYKLMRSDYIVLLDITVPKHWETNGVISSQKIRVDDTSVRYQIFLSPDIMCRLKIEKITYILKDRIVGFMQSEKLYIRPTLVLRKRNEFRALVRKISGCFQDMIDDGVIISFEKKISGEENSRKLYVKVYSEKRIRFKFEFRLDRKLREHDIRNIPRRDRKYDALIFLCLGYDKDTLKQIIVQKNHHVNMDFCWRMRLLR
ncbi:hypothetical protein COB64_01710 [Candidatus Wolfebacteria bacterium]|nr:MAG: hypothetical protein COB64_01710 [Candidatus Wolfebacteria bacterium]